VCELRWARKYLVVVLVLICLSARGVWAADWSCFVEAGRQYGVSPLLLYAIAVHESGMNPGAVNVNRNGTYDYGLMQVNTSWYRELGHERWMCLGDPCYNVYVAAWILSRCVARHGYNWNAVGCYHSSNPKYAQRYVKSIQGIVRKLMRHHGRIGG